MAEPVCAQKGPYALELISGDYWWCGCGQSKKQPFCDSSHKTTAFVPVKFAVTEAEKSGCAAAKAQKIPRSATARINRCKRLRRTARRQAGRGANMMMAMPLMATAAPVRSQTVGRKPSTAHSQTIAVAT